MSAARIIGQVDSAITASNTSKLKQLKLSLTKKASLLLKLDEEIFSQLDEGALKQILSKWTWSKRKSALL